MCLNSWADATSELPFSFAEVASNKIKSGPNPEATARSLRHSLGHTAAAVGAVFVQKCQVVPELCHTKDLPGHGWHGLRSTAPWHCPSCFLFFYRVCGFTVTRLQTP